MAQSFSEQKRSEAVGYFKAKKEFEENDNSEILMKTLWETLDQIYGPNPKYRKIEQ